MTERALRPAAGVPAEEVVARIEKRVGPVRVVGAGESGGKGVAIDTVETDHRELAGAASGGALFCCVPGERYDGHDFARPAAEAGAVALLCERDLSEQLEGCEVLQVVVGEGRVRPAMAEAACCVYGDPAAALEVVGVTGTNGKTTTVHLLGGILEAAGREVSVLGTLSGERTTPEAPLLQRRLAAARRAASASERQGAVAMEVTSHALAQHRVDGYLHRVAVFTNLSQDHLDYHGDMERYFEAKALLFTPEHSERGVANRSDSYGRRLAREAAVPVETFGSEDAEELRAGAGGSSFRLFGREVRLPLIGRVNVENALAAAFAARALGIGEAEIAAALSAAAAVPGRFEPVANALGLEVVVDYAHTPEALRQACEALVELLGAGGRLVVVFGAGGDRDREKRSQMGRVASSVAHVLVVTTDNPRHEDPRAIIEAILAGCDGPAERHVEVDRRRAIALALSLARDLAAVGPAAVLVAGKGHEKTQQVGDELYELDDRKVVAEEASLLAGAA